ncbi:hypothetical protein LCGC14_2079440 [marine sediment metagenome]|uniref:Uncharacterized protein n=1 Tax=marine sediment metagenome TaxID=412755 RepID=A0A0F9HCY7_9ZZZZ
MASSLLKHPKIDQINLDLATMSPYAVAKKYGLTKPKVTRYRDNEWRELAADALNAPIQKRAKNVPKKRTERTQTFPSKQALANVINRDQEHKELIVLSGPQILVKIHEIIKDLDDARKTVMEDEDWSKMIMASKVLLDAGYRLLEIQTKADAMSHDSLESNPEWINMRTLIINALQKHPEALDALTQVMLCD